MKILRTISLLSLLIFAIGPAQAQNDAKAKKLARQAMIKQAVESKNFVFIPEYARGDAGKDISVELASGAQYPFYRLIMKDGVLTSYLPAVSQGTLVVRDETSAVHDKQFESHSYDATVTEKKGIYHLVYDLKDNQYVSKVYIDVTPDGKYSSVRILNYRYGPTNFTGRIKPLKEDTSESTE